MNSGSSWFSAREREEYVDSFEAKLKNAGTTEYLPREFSDEFRNFLGSERSFDLGLFGIKAAFDRGSLCQNASRETTHSSAESFLFQRTCHTKQVNSAEKSNQSVFSSYQNVVMYLRAYLERSKT